MGRCAQAEGCQVGDAELPGNVPAVGADLADTFAEANREAIEFVLGTAGQHWEAVTPDEGWPVGVAARHIALVHQLMTQWLAALQAGKPIPGTADVDAQNTAVAERGIVASPAEVADALRRGGEDVTDALRGLTDADLEREVDFGGRAMPGSLVASAPERHVRNHLASIKAACT
jgi:hypothetical protein